jgi:acylphosphatase
MNTSRRVTRRVIIHGRVQGIGYRVWTEREALARSIEGWVRNRKDGTVEAVFAGMPDAVAGMIEACRQGPALSHVTAVDVHDASQAELTQRRPADKFSLLPTV